MDAQTLLNNLKISKSQILANINQMEIQLKMIQELEVELKERIDQLPPAPPSQESPSPSPPTS